MTTITTTTPRVVLLGDPVGHSVSPAMHNAAFAALGLPARYSARRVSAEALVPAVHALRHEHYLGANVTVPHKERIAPLVDRLTERAATIGAVNTVIREGGALVGDNTDADALLSALESTLGLVPYGMRILLLGAGGAARAAAIALLAHGPASVTIYNRHPARAQALATTMRDLYGGRVRAVDVAMAREEGSDVDLIVNATSAGLDGVSLPLAGLEPRPGAALYDMIYNPSPTPLMRALSAQGVTVADGLTMLVCQAAAAFTLWTGCPAPLETMRGAALAALESRAER